MGNTERPLFLLFGDSITEYSFSLKFTGWAALLSMKYLRRADLINRGLSGYNSRWGLEAVRNIVQEWRSKPPALVIIWLGTNDSSLSGGVSQRQFVPLEEYISNMTDMVARFQAGFPSSKLLLVTPPPVHEEKNLERIQAVAGNVAESDRTQQNTKLYVDACLQVGKQCELPVVNIYEEILAKCGEGGDEVETFLCDGLHLSSKGNHLACDLIEKCISQFFPEISANQLERQFPDHKVLNDESYKELFSS